MLEETQRLRTFFVATSGFALFFWGWAVKNTVGMDNLDLGVISFGSVLIMSSYMLGILAASNGFGSASAITKKLTTASHIFVAINYLLGSYIGFFVLELSGFGIYCAVFTALWLAIAYYGSILMVASTNSVGRLDETVALSS